VARSIALARLDALALRAGRMNLASRRCRVRGGFGAVRALIAPGCRWPEFQDRCAPFAVVLVLEHCIPPRPGCMEIRTELAPLSMSRTRCEAGFRTDSKQPDACYTSTCSNLLRFFPRSADIEPQQQYRCLIDIPEITTRTASTQLSLNVALRLHATGRSRARLLEPLDNL